MKKRMWNENTDRELTRAGLLVCMILGAAAEGITFAAVGIRLTYVPFPVLIFLWTVFSFLSTGVLLLTDLIEQKIGECLAVWQQKRASAEGEKGLIEALRAALNRTMSEVLDRETAESDCAVIYQLPISENSEWNRWEEYPENPELRRKAS